MLYFSGYRHSNADKPLHPVQQSVVQDRTTLVSLPPSHLQMQRTANLIGRHDVINYQNPSMNQRQQPIFWTLPKRNAEAPDSSRFPEMRTNSYRPSKHVTSDFDDKYATRDNIHPSVKHEDSIRVSPIDPRTSGSFKSSTPSNKENVVDLTTKLLSPVKSCMTNEELYAVIHKSKKKLNIKDPSDRSASPALSSISLSPVGSEISLVTKGSLKQPESGYLMDPRSRNSWAYSNEKPVISLHGTIPRRHHSTKTESCADRYGPIPQTSRLDFKKLLLQHSVKLNNVTPQTRPNKLSAVEQLKLSREKNPSTPAIPIANTSNINILDLSGSPKTYNHRKFFKTNPPPASPGRANTLIKEHKATPKILLSPKSQWRFSSPRSDVLSSPIPEANNEDDNSNSSGDKTDSPNSTSSKPIPTNNHFGARRNLIPINENVFESDSNFVVNIDHGVFPLGIDSSKEHAKSRAEILQARRAQFFNTSPESSPPRFTSFKSSPTPGSPSRVQETSNEGKTSPTLETAL